MRVESQCTFTKRLLIAACRRTLLDKTLNGDESMCFGATMSASPLLSIVVASFRHLFPRFFRYAASLSSNFKLNFGVHDNNLFGIRCIVAAAHTPHPAAMASHINA